MKKILLLFFITSVSLFSYEPDYAMYCDERQDSVACIKAALKNKYSTKSYISYLTKACDYNNKDGCYMLSKAYIDYKKDPAKSGEYYLKSCNMGHAKACYDIGMMAQNLGRHFQKKLYLDKACEFGYKQACDLLGKYDD